MHECELTSSTVRGMQIRYSFINMALRRWRGEAAEEAIWQNQPKKNKNPSPHFCIGNHLSGLLRFVGGVSQYKTFFTSPEGDNDTNLPPPPPCYQQLSLSPRAPRWSLEDVRSAGAGGEERRGHGTKLQDKSFPLARGEEGNTKRKAKQSKSAVALLLLLLPSLPPLSFFCCVALSLRQPLPLRQERAYGCRAQFLPTAQSGQGCASVRGAVRSRQRKQVPPQRQSKSIPIGEASHTMS